jgi:threonine dehydrogenase-like Zn-dependent dehydrogenase
MASVTSRQQQQVPQCTIQYKENPGRPMKAVEWHGKRNMKVTERPSPAITDPADAILKVSSTCICGSDLHIYNGAIQYMTQGDSMGHEFMGIVDEVGPNVKNIKKGDKVVACFDIACGQCWFCKHEDYSLCDATNNSKEEKELYGYTTAGFYGYSKVTGQWPGGQAQYARVPFADVNLLKLPKDAPDDKYILLSDILPTAWNANEMGDVGEGDCVAIWGAGPVGQLAAMLAYQVRKAAKVIIIDSEQYRLDHVRKHVPGVETINRKEHKVPEKLLEIWPRGPDVGIEAVGCHYQNTLLHKAEMAVSLETDPSEMLDEMIYSVRKGGRISIVGVYVGYTNHYNIGAFMEKGMQMRGAQTPCQKFWGFLKDLIDEGKIDPTFVITHKPPLEEASEHYKMFDEKKDGVVKVVMKPWSTEE